MECSKLPRQPLFSSVGPLLPTQGTDIVPYYNSVCWCAGVIAIEPDVHAVAVMGSGQPSIANGHGPATKKAAPAKTVSAICGHVRCRAMS